MKALRVPAVASWALAALLMSSGCETTPDPRFPLIVGASYSKSDVMPCADYASFTNYSGRPYLVTVPETGVITRRHEGMDFCTQPHAEVLAPANGIVSTVVQENAFRGGRVTIRTNLIYRDDGVPFVLCLDMVHIAPRSGLRTGNMVKAGDVIGTVEPPGKLEIGPRSHVHFSAGPRADTWNLHTDPNRFWQKGQGAVSCFRADTPPTDPQIVAPIRC